MSQESLSAHTAVSKSSYTQCFAFGTKDVRRCRLECREGEKTCYVHRNYYKNWFLNHRPFTSKYHITDRQIEEYKFQIQGGHIEISDTYLEKIIPIHYDYYIFLIKCTKKSPSLNPMALQSYINATLQPIYLYPLSISKYKLKENIKECMRTVLFDLESCKIVFSCIISFAFQYMFYTDLNRFSEYDYQWILENLLLENFEWKQLLYSTLMDTLYKEHCELFIHKSSDQVYAKYIIHTYMSPVLNEVLSIFTILYKTKLEDRIRAHKAEILEKAWHPRRLEHFLALGYTIEEVFGDFIY